MTITPDIQKGFDALQSQIEGLEEDISAEGRQGHIGVPGKPGRNPPGAVLLKSAEYTLPAGTEPSSLAITPEGDFLFVGGSEAKNITIFARDTETGLLTDLGVQAVAEGKVSALAVDPAGEYLYVFTQSKQSVQSFRIAKTGELTHLQTIEIKKGAGGSPRMIISPDGKYLYIWHYAEIAAKEGSYISTYAVAAGHLTYVASVELANENSHHLAVSPDGEFLYALEYGEGAHLEIFMIAAGELTPLETIAVSKQLSGIAITPAGDNLYLAGWGEFIQYKRNLETGELTELTGSKLFLGNESTVAPMVVAPAEFAVYCGESNSSSVAQLKRSGRTGQCTVLEPAAVPVGGIAEAIVMSQDGVSLYTCNRDNTVGSFTTE